MHEACGFRRVAFELGIVDGGERPGRGNRLVWFLRRRDGRRWWRHFGLDAAQVGVRAGYNFQFGTFVLGAEAEFFGSGLQGNEAVGEFTARTDIDWLGTVQARFGYTAGRLMVFSTAGLAYGDVSLRYSIASASVEDSSTELGWTVGVGAEYQLTEKLSLRGEYKHVDLGDHTFLTDVGYDADLATRVDIGLLGVSYRF